MCSWSLKLSSPNVCLSYVSAIKYIYVRKSILAFIQSAIREGYSRIHYRDLARDRDGSVSVSERCSSIHQHFREKQRMGGWGFHCKGAGLNLLLYLFTFYVWRDIWGRVFQSWTVPFSIEIKRECFTARAPFSICLCSGRGSQNKRGPPTFASTVNTAQMADSVHFKCLHACKL